MKHIIILHGAIGAADQMQAIKNIFSKEYQIHTPSFYGHGGTATQEPFRVEGFSKQLESYIEDNQLHKPLIVGYSMGGFVALHYAQKHTNKISGIVTLATKFEWSPEIASKETKMLDPKVIQEKVPAFASALAKRHGEDSWAHVLNKTADMMRHLGNNNPLTSLENICIPVLCCIGDRDNMVSVEETHNLYKTLPNASFCVIPNTPHPIEKLNLDVFTAVVLQFALNTHSQR
ncbi:MAG: alpha/beta hydrolase [Cryomorphaceae bacterium]|nr:alpha/beta hydrolase [Cryomorphaceae bacterium]